MKFVSTIVTSAFVVLIATGCAAPQPQVTQSANRSAGKPLSQEHKYCLGMAGVTANVIQLGRTGRYTDAQIHAQNYQLIRQAGWPLGQADYNEAIKIGLVGLRGGDDPRSTAGLILSECMNYGWYRR